MCCLQTGDPGKAVVEFSLSLEALELGDQWCKWSESESLRIRRAREDGCLRSTRERGSSPFFHLFALYGPPMGLADAFPHWGGTSALFSSIQMLTSSRNSLIETSRNNVLPAISASLSSIILTQKIKHHRDRGKKGHQNVM